MKDFSGKKRVIIENITPQINAGQFPIKRIVGEQVCVEADVYSDGHDIVKALLLFKKSDVENWEEVPMEFMGNDCWSASFTPTEIGSYDYTVKGWVDHVGTWQHGLEKKHEAQLDLKLDLLIGAEFMKEAAEKSTEMKKEFNDHIVLFKSSSEDIKNIITKALHPSIADNYNKVMDSPNATVNDKIFKVQVENKKALFSTWYELFPRSTSDKPGKHGTFKDCERLLPRIQEMGFDIIYLPPIHPLGIQFRKGKNNSTTAQPNEPGSPWAIGSKEGGHKAIHPELGTLKDFTNFIEKAKTFDIDIAIDFALQCSPDHPYVKEHPQWFKWRPDGTVQYAENPPKKYQDVLPINFETEDWENLWNELKSILEYWIDKGVKIFRVDNPHTKPFIFWEWLIKEIKTNHPDTIFLAEAFTRPKIMQRLGKIGFTQSYTYFTWRSTPQELITYVTELAKTEMREYYRPNFWPNTPDILPPVLQTGGEPAHIIRVLLAGTLSSNYGLYGPVYEYGEATPIANGKEEYLDSEKYEIKLWDWEKQTKIRQIITQLNRIRKENAALQTTWNITFVETDNNQFLSYIKTDDSKTNKLLIVVSLDPTYPQSGWVKLPLGDLGINPEQPYHLQDLITENHYTWHHEWNYVELRPEKIPAHIFKIEQ